MGEIIKIILFLCILTIFWGCRISNNSQLPPLPKTIYLQKKKNITIQARLERPTNRERNTSAITIQSSNTNVVEIYAFRYNVGCTYCGGSPVFYGVSFTVGGVEVGEADLIISTKMPLNDTIHTFSDTVHVSIL